MTRRTLRNKRPADETETIPAPPSMEAPTAAQPRPRPLTLLDLPLDAWAAILEAGSSSSSSGSGSSSSGSGSIREDEGEGEEGGEGEGDGRGQRLERDSGLQPADLACLRLSCRALDAALSDGEALLAPSRLALRASGRAAAWLLAARPPPLPPPRSPPGLAPSLRASTVRALWLDLVDDDAAALLGAALVGRRGGGNRRGASFAAAAPLLESLDLCVSQLPSLRAAADAQAAGAPPPTLDVAAFVPRISPGPFSPRGGGYRGLRHLGVHGAAACLRSAAATGEGEGGNRLRSLVSLSLDTAHSGAVWCPVYRNWGDVAELGLAAAAAAAEGVEGAGGAGAGGGGGDEEGKGAPPLAAAATPNLRCLALRLHPRGPWRGVAAARLPAASLTSLTLMVSTPLRGDLDEPLRGVARAMPLLRRLRVENRGSGGVPDALLPPPPPPPDDGRWDRPAGSAGAGSDGDGGGEDGRRQERAAGLPLAASLALSLDVLRSPLLDPPRDGGGGGPGSPPSLETAATAALARSRRRQGPPGGGGGGPALLPRLVGIGGGDAAFSPPPPPLRPRASSVGSLGLLVELSVGSGSAPRTFPSAGELPSLPPRSPLFPSLSAPGAASNAAAAAAAVVVVADLSVLSGAPRLERLELRDFGLVRGLGGAATPRLRRLAVRVSARHAGGGAAAAAGSDPPARPHPPPPLVVVEWPRGGGGGNGDDGDDAGMPLLRSLEVSCGRANGVSFRHAGAGAAAAAGAPPAAEEALELEAAGARLGARLRALCFVAGGAGGGVPEAGEAGEPPPPPPPSWWGCRFLTAAAGEFSRRGSDRGDPLGGRTLRAPPPGPGRGAGASSPASAAAAALSPSSSSDCCLWPVRVLASERGLLGPAGSSGAALRSVAAVAGGAPRPLLRELFGRGGLGAGEGDAFAALGPLPPPAL
jgi:hypothetical protein